MQSHYTYAFQPCCFGSFKATFCLLPPRRGQICHKEIAMKPKKGIRYVGVQIKPSFGATIPTRNDRCQVKGLAGVGFLGKTSIDLQRFVREAVTASNICRKS